MEDQPHAPVGTTHLRGRQTKFVTKPALQTLIIHITDEANYSSEECYGVQICFILLSWLNIWRFENAYYLAFPINGHPFGMTLVFLGKEQHQKYLHGNFEQLLISC